MALSGGVHEPMDAVEAVMVGDADGVQLVSALLCRGPGCLTAMRREFERWGEGEHIRSIHHLRGQMSLPGQQHGNIERAHYQRILQSWHVPGSPGAGQ